MYLPDVRGPAQLGDYYLNRSGMVNMPDEWKGGINTAQFGRYVAQQEQGAFTQYGYLVKSGDVWQKSTRASLCRRIPGTVLSCAGSHAGCSQYPAACST